MAKRENNKRFKKVDDGITTKAVDVRRVTKITKGGRNLNFSALVVAGDKKGRVGVGMGRASEPVAAIQKGELAAKRNMITVPIVDGSIPHEIYGKFGSANILLLPAKKGTGVIAGGPVRAVIELAGIKDILSKSYGSRNKINSVKATIEGLKALKTKEAVAALRGIKPEDL